MKIFIIMLFLFFSFTSPAFASIQMCQQIIHGDNPAYYAMRYFSWDTSDPYPGNVTLAQSCDAALGAGNILSSAQGRTRIIGVRLIPNPKVITDQYGNQRLDDSRYSYSIKRSEVDAQVQQCSGGWSFPGMMSTIGSFPASPENARIPTVISNMAGHGTLASNLAIELYSGVWQFLGMLMIFKIIKTLIPGA